MYIYIHKPAYPIKTYLVHLIYLKEQKQGVLSCEYITNLFEESIKIKNVKTCFFKIHSLKLNFKNNFFNFFSDLLRSTL